MIYKPFRGLPVENADGQTLLTYATTVTPADCDDSVRLAPIQLQRRIDKVCDVRVTIVDDHLSAVVPRQNGTAPLDWRVDHNALDWSPIDVPADVRTGLGALCAALGLRFAACDFSVDHDGRWWFLEANPAGQWAWQHPLLDQLTSAIADALTGKASP